VFSDHRRSAERRIRAAIYHLIKPAQGDVLVGRVDVAEAPLQWMAGVHGARAGYGEGPVDRSDRSVHRLLAGQRDPCGLLAAEFHS